MFQLIYTNFPGFHFYNHSLKLIHKFQNSIRNISNLNSDSKVKEYKLNNIIYKIYNLNENEIKLIEDDLI